MKRLLIAIFASVLLSLLTVLGTVVAQDTAKPATPGVDELIANGKALVATKNFDAAIACYNDALKLATDAKQQGDIHYRLALVYVEKGDKKTAMREYDEAIRCDPGNSDAYCYRAALYFEAGEFDKSLADCNEAIRLDPGKGDAYHSRAITLEHNGAFDKALEDMNRAIALKPSRNARHYCDRGKIYDDLGQPDKALADETEAIRLDPKLSPAYANRASLEFRTGAFERSVADYGEAMRLDPQNSANYIGRGVAELSLQELDKALADETEGIRLDPGSAMAHCNSGVIHGLQGDTGKAVAEYTEAIRLDPHFYRAYFGRGTCYTTQHQFDKAIQDFDISLSLQPGMTAALRSLGICHFIKGDYDKAAADYTEAIRLDPKDASAYSLRAEVYAKKGDTGQAIGDDTTAISLNPALVGAYEDRGVDYADQNQWGKALADFNEVIRLDPKHPVAYARRAYVESMIGDNASAIADYGQAIQVDGKSIGACGNLAWLLATSPIPGQRDGKAAVKYAQTACEDSKWADPFSIKALAAAYAESRDFANAIKYEQQYLALPGLKESQIANGKYLLQLYQTGKPCHLLSVFDFATQSSMVATPMKPALTALIALGLFTGAPLSAADKPAREQQAALQRAQTASFITRVAYAKSHADPVIYGGKGGGLSCIVYTVKHGIGGAPGYTMIIATDTGPSPVSDIAVLCDTAAVTGPARIIKCTGHVLWFQDRDFTAGGEGLVLQLNLGNAGPLLQFTGPRKTLSM